MKILKYPLVLLSLLLDLVSLIACVAFKKLGPLGITVITWAFIVLFAFLFPIGLSGCTGPSVNNTTKEDKTMIIRFYNNIEFDLPAAPGSVAFYPVSPGALYHFGVISPYLAAAESAPVPITSGMNPESNVEIVRYRFRAVGVTGLRVGWDLAFSSNPPPFVAVGFGRKIQGSTNVWPHVALPYTFDGEWVETSIMLEHNGTPGKLRPSWEFEELIFDTRKLDPTLYGTKVRLFLEIDVKCTPIGF